MSSYEQITEKGDGLEEKLVSVDRNTKVVKGGRVFSFAATVVVGDKKGRVGHARCKAKEVPVAIEKAMKKARRNMVSVKLNKGTLYHEVLGRHGASSVFMKPASEGTGLIAGGAMRAVLEVAGVTDVLAKCIRSSNPSNVVRATIKGLLLTTSPESIALKRGKTLKQISGVK
jgi:small subunit ribosomal protein S5